MLRQATFTSPYVCGQHVAGHGRQISAPGQVAPWRNDYVFEKGVIVMIPGENKEHYTVLDEKTFIVLEVKEEHLTRLP
jgi:hypothetical protein